MNAPNSPSSIGARARRAATGLLAACALVLAGCATRLPAEAPRALLHDEYFAAADIETIDEKALFAVSEPMRRFLETELRAGAGRQDPRRALLEALYGRGRLHLSYDATRTRTAAQAFEDRAGNCLSLVVMTAAFAKELGLPVNFRAALVEDSYARSNGLLLANGHVFLTLEPPPLTGRVVRTDGTLTVDFFPPEDVGTMLSATLPERTVVAMYYNNRAAETLVEGSLEQAYAWARAALLHNPEYAASANTLAVIYMRKGRWPEAEAALRFALRQDDDNTAALTNLRSVLLSQNRLAEAQVVGQQLAALQPVAPFHDYELGRTAMRDGKYREASDLFRRELKRQPYQPEVNFWAAQARWQLGDVKGAAEHMQRAVDTSITSETRQQYSAKLEYLRAQRVQ